jgi:hypothetical protein
MATIDPETERKRLLDFYTRQMDGRLEQIASQAAGLTDLAREVLQDELARRDLKVELQSPLVENIPPVAPVEPTPQESEIVEEQSVSGELAKRNLVTIRKFRDLPEALLAKGSLDSAGIESSLGDDNMVRLDWFISNLLGGIKLLVDAQDAEAANEILSQPIPERFEVEGAEEYQQPHCPQCHSLDVSFEELYKPIAYASLYLEVPLPIHRKGWICQSCHHTWQADETEDEAEAI